MSSGLHGRQEGALHQVPASQAPQADSGAAGKAIDGLRTELLRLMMLWQSEA